MMLTETHTDAECFVTLANDWHKLLSRSVINHVFLTPEFLKAWWITLGHGELHMLTIRNGEKELLGIAPMYTFTNAEGKKQISIVGCVDVSDYLDFIIDKDNKEAVYHEIGMYITNLKKIECAFFFSIPQISPSLTMFKENMVKVGWIAEQTQQDICPIIELPTTWDEYLASIGKKQRHEIKRKWKKLFEEQQAEFELIKLPNDTDSAMDDFIYLHQASSQDKKNFWDDSHVKFFKYFAQKTAERNWLKLYFLKVNGMRVAAMLGFEYNANFFLYNSGFVSDHYREYGIGSVLTAYTIQQAIEHKNGRYDFLRGDEEYKFRFRAKAEPIFDLKLTRSL